jgi:endoglucanase
MAPAVSTNNEVLKTSANYPFVKQDGTPVKINGVNQRNVGSYSPASLCGGDINNWAGWKARGLNAVRLAMDWPSFEPTQGTISTTALQRLDDTIAAAKNNGLYVILDPIHLKTVSGNLPNWVSGQNAIQKIQNNGSFYLKTIAARYKNDPKVIAIDLVNEPHVNPLPFDQNSNLTMYNTLINAVRSVDAEKILMIEPITGDSSWDGVDWNILQNKYNLVLSHHSYFAGGDDDGYSASGWGGAGNSLSSGSADYLSSTTSYAEMARHYDKMVGWSQVSGLPLYLGEYGIGRDVNNRDLWISQNVALLNQRNIARTYWEGCSDGNMNLHLNSSNTWATYINLLQYP